MVRITPFETYGMWNRSFSNFQDCENVVLLYSITVGVSLGDLTKIFLIDNLKLHKNKYFLNRFCSVFLTILRGCLSQVNGTSVNWSPPPKPALI